MANSRSTTERKWQQRSAVAAPTTIAKVHEAAAKEKAAANRTISMSRGGSRRGGDRTDHQPGADGWTLSGNIPRAPPKAGDLSKFGQISKGPPTTFGPSSLFVGKDNKRESLSRSNSSANTFQMLQNVEAAEVATEISRLPSRKASVDLGPGGAPEPAPQRKRLNLLPRTRPLDQDSALRQESDSDTNKDVTNEPEQEMSKEAEKKVDEDTKEFFGVRNLKEAEIYSAKLPSNHHHKAAAKEKAAAEKNAAYRTISMSRGGSRRGEDRADHQPGVDSWTLSGNIPRAPPKAGDLSKFGQIGKGARGDRADHWPSADSWTLSGNTPHAPPKGGDSPKFGQINKGTRGDRVDHQPSADSWTLSGSTPRALPKAGDLSKFGQISKSARRDRVDHQPSRTLSGNTPHAPPKARDLSKFGEISKGLPMTYGPSSVWKKDNKRESLSRSNPSVEVAEVATKTSRLPSRKTIVDLGPGDAPEPAPQRKRLNLLPRTRPLDQDSALSQELDSDTDADATDEPEQEMSKEEAKKKIDEDTKEFFGGVRNLEEAEIYFAKLPSNHHHILVDRLVSSAIESEEADAKLVGDFFQRASSKKLCSASAFEEGFFGTAEFLDDIAIDAPKATDLFAIMIKGADLSEEQRTTIASKSSENGEKLAKLVLS